MNCSICYYFCNLDYTTHTYIKQKKNAADKKNRSAKKQKQKRMFLSVTQINSNEFRFEKKNSKQQLIRDTVFRFD